MSNVGRIPAAVFLILTNILRRFSGACCLQGVFPVRSCAKSNTYNLKQIQQGADQTDHSACGIYGAPYSPTINIAQVFLLLLASQAREHMHRLISE